MLRLAALLAAADPAAPARSSGGTAMVVLTVLVLLGGLFAVVLFVSLRRWRNPRRPLHEASADDGPDPWVEAGKRVGPPQNERSGA